MQTPRAAPQSTLPHRPCQLPPYNEVSRSRVWTQKQCTDVGPQYVCRPSVRVQALSMCAGLQYVCRPSVCGQALSMCAGPQYVCRPSGMCAGLQYVCRALCSQYVCRASVCVYICIYIALCISVSKSGFPFIFSHKISKHCSPTKHTHLLFHPSLRSGMSLTS